MTDTLAIRGPCAGHLRLVPSGELDLATAPALRQELADASAAGSTLVVLDLGEVEFLDSVGLSVIIGGHKRLTLQGGRLHLAGARAIVRRVLDITRVDAVVPTYETVAEAESDCPSAHAFA